MPYGGAWAVDDKELLHFIKNIKSSSTETKKFMTDYKQWIASTHEITGWDKFNHLCFSNGTTESFDKFYHRHLHRRLRILKGEYFYHQLMGKKVFKEFDWLNNENILEKNDVVVISVPFADTGNVPLNLYEILDRCEELKIPVLLDLAYINLATNLKLNLNYKCIDTITSSLSKVFPLSHYRIGIRLQRKLIDDTLIAYNDNQYVNLHSIGIGHAVIKKYNANYSFQKYRAQQINICEAMSITPSSCFIFGIDKKDSYKEYSRGANTNRLCLSKHFQQ
jgi:histidinol-phosphate/aromatic aminotransferase/cobyric acid decarboxylase-like protein